MKIYDEYEKVMDLIETHGDELDISDYFKRGFVDLLRYLSFLECELTSHPEWEERFDDVVILKHRVAEFYDTISALLIYFRNIREIENELYRSDQDGQKDDADIQGRDEMHEGMVRDDRDSSIDTDQQTE